MEDLDEHLERVNLAREIRGLPPLTPEGLAEHHRERAEKEAEDERWLGPVTRGEVCAGCHRALDPHEPMVLMKGSVEIAWYRLHAGCKDCFKAAVAEEVKWRRELHDDKVEWLEFEGGGDLEPFDEEEEIKRARRNVLLGWGEVHGSECFGCGRRLFHRRHLHSNRKHVACCLRCQRRAWRGQRFDQQTAVCEACGKAFKRQRSDSRYCSGACRQKAYRERIRSS